MGDCFENAPYASLIGFVLILSGCGIMCGSNFEALRRTNNVFEDHFYPIHWPIVVEIAGIIISVVTTIFAACNLSIGTITTGSRRRKIFAHSSTQSKGQRISLAFLVIAYFFTTTWLFIFIALAMAVSLWCMLHTVCRQETDYWRGISADKADQGETEFTYILNLTTYGMYHRPLDTSLYSETINSPSAFTHLCQELSTVGPLFAIALIASFLVIIGLTIEVACLSNSIVVLDYSPELDRYRRLVTNIDPSEMHPNLATTCLMEEYSLQPLLGSLAAPLPPPSLTSRLPSESFLHHTNNFAVNSPNDLGNYGSPQGGGSIGRPVVLGHGRYAAASSATLGPIQSPMASNYGLSQSSLAQQPPTSYYHYHPHHHHQLSLQSRNRSQTSGFVEE